MNYKKKMMKVMNRYGYNLTDKDKLIDMVLTIQEQIQIIKALQAAGMFVETKQKVKKLQVA